MKSEVLLVTGSRAFDGHPAAMRWARSVLLREFATVLERTDNVRVVTGDADGIDALARELAHGLTVAIPTISLSTFWLDGAISHSDRENERWTDESPPSPGTPERKTWPLVRNRAIVERVAAFKGEKRGLALHAMWSRSHGTQQTAGLLRTAGIYVVGYQCPEDLRGKP